MVRARSFLPLVFLPPSQGDPESLSFVPGLSELGLPRWEPGPRARGLGPWPPPCGVGPMPARARGYPCSQRPVSVQVLNETDGLPPPLFFYDVEQNKQVLQRNCQCDFPGRFGLNQNAGLCPDLCDLG